LNKTFKRYKGISGMGTAQIILRELDIFDIETDIPGIGRSEK
jgi:hypothetical protein